VVLSATCCVTLSSANLASANANNKKKLRTEIKIISVRVVTELEAERSLSVGSIPSDEQNPFRPAQ
jgi:hypothetical protein